LKYWLVVVTAALSMMAMTPSQGAAPDVRTAFSAP
jgi:hypothetical protein